VLNEHKSNWTEVKSGIPQGSMLGPILFIIYINDLTEVVSSTCKRFADDAKIYTTVTSRQDQEDPQKDLDNVCQWSSDWLLKFNIQKCKVVSYGNVSSQYNYVMDEDTGGASALSSEDSEKDLRIIFTNKLNFEKHINSTVNKVNKCISLHTWISPCFNNV